MLRQVFCPADRLMSDSTSSANGTGVPAWQLGQARLAKGDLPGALESFRDAASHGHTDAQIELARMLLFGLATAPEPVQAIAWLTRAEQAGHVAAGYLLAQVAAGNTLLALDERADARLLAGVEARFPPSLRAAAIVFARKPHERGQVLATKLLQAAAKRGDSIAAQLLAERIERGVGCSPDPDAAEQLRTQIAQVHAPRLPPLDESRMSGAMGTQDAGPPTLDLSEYLRTPEMELLSTQPAVRIVRGLLNADECRLLIAMANPLLHPSRTVDPHTGQPVAVELRTSHDAPFDVLNEDLAVRLVQARMAAAAGLPLDQAEQLIVLRYEPGQEYRPHRDYLPPDAIARDRPNAGNRMRTICVYLNTVEAGGATEFPRAGLRVEPRAGDAIVFENLDAQGMPDADTLHAGLPVERGVKWLATLWFRQCPYRTF